MLKFSPLSPLAAFPPATIRSVRIRPTDLLLRALLKLLKALDTRDDSLDSLQPEAVRCILLISSTALGDTALSTATFAPLRARFPAARLVALIHRQYLPLFSHCAELDQVVPFHGGYRHFLATARTLRKMHPDLALILHGNEPQATPLAYLSGARFIVKLPNASEFRFLLSNRDTPSTWAQFTHGLDQRLGEAALVGADIAGARMALPTVPDAREEVDAFLAACGLAGKRLIGLQCGASSRSRMWPAQHFIELGRRLLASHPAMGLVLTGAPDEAAYLEGIVAGIGGAVVNTAGKLSLAALPTLVGRCKALVTGDTGTMHIAVAMGTPIVGLFAVSTPAASGPAYDLDRHVIIHQPCPDHFVRSKSDDQTCISRISVDRVFAATQSVLERP